MSETPKGKEFRTLVLERLHDLRIDFTPLIHHAVQKSLPSRDDFKEAMKEAVVEVMQGTSVEVRCLKESPESECTSGEVVTVPTSEEMDEKFEEFENRLETQKLLNHNFSTNLESLLSKVTQIESQIQTYGPILELLNSNRTRLECFINNLNSLHESNDELRRSNQELRATVRSMQDQIASLLKAYPIEPGTDSDYDNA